MERDMQQTTVCIGGCGFYGSAATEGYCSKCFKDSIKRKQDPQRLSPTGAQVNAAAQAGLMATSADHHVSASTSNSTTQTASAISEGSVASTQMDMSSASATTPGAVSNTLAVPCATQTIASGTTLTGVCSTSSFESMQSDDSTQAALSASAPSGSAMPQAKKKNRCHGCNKKVGLTGFTCRCGGLYCSEHRYSDSHDCGFDYKALGAAEIRKNNPLVVGDKINKL